MNLLVAGGAGYVGAWLVPHLLAAGHKVTVLDTMWFGDGYLPQDNGNLAVIKGDVRDSEKYVDAAQGKDAILWLSSISNNAMYGVNRVLTRAVNTFVWKSGNRFIYASSAAVMDPTSDYAKDKLFCEAVLAKSEAVIVRSASVCGYSPNMRFDTTINRMVHDHHKDGVIKVAGGEQYRTHVSIRDISRFYQHLCETKDFPYGSTFNVVSANQTVRESAELIGEYETGPRTDDRSYRLKDTTFTTGFEYRHSVEGAINDMKIKFESGHWKDTSDEKMWRVNRGI